MAGIQHGQSSMAAYMYMESACCFILPSAYSAVSLLILSFLAPSHPYSFLWQCLPFSSVYWEAIPWFWCHRGSQRRICFGSQRRLWSWTFEEFWNCHDWGESWRWAEFVLHLNMYKNQGWPELDHHCINWRSLGSSWQELELVSLCYQFD